MRKNISVILTSLALGVTIINAILNNFNGGWGIACLAWIIVLIRDVEDLKENRDD